MEEVERDLMGQEEFEQYLSSTRTLGTYEAVSKFKSIKRAMRRGHVTISGMIIPDRPFNNRHNSSKRKGIQSRSSNDLKRFIYGRIKNQRGKA